MSDDLLPSMIPFMGCVIEHVPDGVRLTGASRDHMMAAAITCRTFRPPFTIKTVAKTDSTNLRLYWHVGEVIFNWECSIRRLKVHDPATGQWWDAEDEGFIEVDKWHEIAWEIKPNSMRVLVDGKARFERVGEWANIDAPVATAGGWDPVGSIQRAGESPKPGVRSSQGVGQWPSSTPICRAGPGRRRIRRCQRR